MSKDCKLNDYGITGTNKLHDICLFIIHTSVLYTRILNRNNKREKKSVFSNLNS